MTVGTAQVYKSVDKNELKLYASKPADWKTNDQRPTMVFFHGGGWVAGKPGQFTEHSKHLAKLGMVVVQVQYRLLLMVMKTAVGTRERARNRDNG